MKVATKKMVSLVRWGRFFALIVAGLAALSLWSWGAGLVQLFAFMLHHKPMAPSTALCFGLLSAVLLLRERFPDQPAMGRWGRGLTGVVAGVGAFACLRAFFGWDSPVEAWLAQSSERIGNQPVGQMWPLTGALLFLAVAAYWLQSYSPAPRSVRWWLAIVLALSVSLVGFGIAASYAFSNHWFADSPARPMALATALASGFLGGALLAGQREGRLGAASASASPPLPFVRTNKLAVLVATALAILLSTGTALYLHIEQAEKREDASRLLDAVAHLKLAQIVNWRQERLNDARFFMQAEFVARDVEAFLYQPDSERTRSRLVHWFNLLKGGDRYAFVALLDTNSAVRFSLPKDTDALASFGHLLDDVAPTDEITLSDLYRDPASGDVYLNMTFPVYSDSTHPTNLAGPPPVLLGRVLIRIDPRQFLYPLLHSWPIPSASAETIMFRREGNEVVYLNQLRHLTNGPMTLRLSITTNSQLPSVQAVVTKPGLIEGRDYRGVPVLTDIRPVPDTGWYLVAKVDQSEIYSDVREQAWLTLLLTVVLTTAAGLLVGFVNKRKQAEGALRELLAERKQLELAQRVEHLMKFANDAIMLADEHDGIVEANDRMLQMYGYSWEELRVLRLPALRAVEVRAGFAQETQQVLAAGQAFFETLHRRKDGSVFPVEISSKVIELDGAPFRLGILRDISERKAHEREIVRLNRLYVTLSEVNQMIVRVQSREELFREVCRVAVEFGGFKLAWIGWPDAGTQQLVPIARAGDDAGYLDRIKVFADNRPEGRGLMGTTWCTGQTSVCNDFSCDPHPVPWHATALAHGLHCAAALAIRFQGEICGIFSVYSAEPGVFQERELALLEEMAVDVAYALDQLHQRELRQQAEVNREAFMTLALRLSAAQNPTDAGRIIFDTADRFWKWDAGTLDICLPGGALVQAVFQVDIVDGVRSELSGPGRIGEPTPRIRRVLDEGAELLLRQPPLPAASDSITIGDTARVSASIMSAPLRLHGQAVGVISVQSYVLNAFSEADLLTLQALADHCAGAQQRIQTEQALRENEELYRTLVAASPNAVTVIDLAGRVVFASAKTFEMFGAASLAKVVGRSVLDWVAPEERARALENIRHLPEHRQLFETEYLMLRKDGTRFSAEVTVGGFNGGDGQPKGKILVVRDITERKQREQREQLHLRTLQLLATGATFPEVLESIVALLECGHEDWRGAIMLVDESGRHLVHGAAPRLPEFYQQAINGIEIRPGVGSCGAAAATKRLVAVEDIATHPYWEGFREVAHRADLRACWSLPILSPGGAVLGTVAIYHAVPRVPTWEEVHAITGITGLASIAIEQRRTETALRESEGRLKLALMASQMGVWEWDLQTNAVFWSPECYDITGVNPEMGSLTLEHFISLLHPDDRTPVQVTAEQAIANHTRFHSEFRLIRPDGSLRWLADDARAVYDVAGKPLRLVGTVQDITARKLAEAEIRKLSLAVEQSPAAIVLTNPAGDIEYVNAKFTQVSGYTLDEVRGRNPRVLKSGETSPEKYLQLWQTITSGREWSGELHNKRKNGELFWEFARISPVLDETGHITHFLAVKEDITERKRLESQFRQAQKMEAVGQLAGGVAHDFNNILAAVMMHLGLLRDVPNLEPFLASSLRELETETQRAASLTRQLLMFSRRSVMQVKALDVNEVVEHLLKMLRRLIGEQINLEWQGRSQLPAVSGDSGMLEQVLMNLVVNARDAMPHGGRIVIATELVEADAEQVRANPEARPGRYVCLSVADNGSGMDEATQKRIFEPFFTTKEAGKGTGLGLATVYGIASQHKGWVSVVSEVGRGSTFRVFLPASDAVINGTVAPPGAGPLRGGKETILLVEDEPSVRKTTGNFLRMCGYEVIEAVSGLEALSFWGLHWKRVDLLFTDMVMPGGINGLQLSEKLRATKPELKVIIASGYSADLVQQSDLAGKGIVFVPKPCSPADLTVVLRRCLDRSPA